MTKLLKKLIFVLLPLVVFIAAFEHLSRTIPTSYSSKNDYLMKKKEKIEVLVLGSSHANFGINPQFFGREGFNISNTSQCLSYDYKVLSKYLPLCNNVKLVIIPISYFTLQYKLTLSPENWRTAYYSLFLDIPDDAPSSIFDLRKYSALVLWDGPLRVIYNLRKVKKLNINEFGYQYPEYSAGNINDIINDKTGKGRVAYHENRVSHGDKTSESELRKDNLKTLGKIADLLASKNIKMAFVVTPVFKTYYENVSKIRYDEMAASVDAIAGKYNTRRFDYFRDSRFNLSDFSDNDHLNEAGAKKFSIILKNEVINTLM